MADLQKVLPGQRQRIPAAAYNAFVDAANWVSQRQRDGGAGQAGDKQPEGLVLVKNDTASDVPRFGVLGIDGPIFTPTENEDEFKRRFSLKGVAPVVTDHAGKFVITWQPIAAGKIGRAWINGTCPAKVNVAAEGDGYADVAEGDTAKLASSSSGAAQILWAEPGTGEKWAIVRLSPAAPAVIRAKITGNAQDGTNKRWAYAWSEVEKTTAGYGGWTVKAGGLSGTTSADTLYNLSEDMNGATGLWGNGVTSTNLAGTAMDIQPIPTNTIVFARRETLSDGTVEYWCQYENAIDGTCE